MKLSALYSINKCHIYKTLSDSLVQLRTVLSGDILMSNAVNKLLQLIGATHVCFSHLYIFLIDSV